MTPLKVFCSYSHRDEDALNQLRNHLSGLRRQGLIEDWHDRQIPPGGDWDETIRQNLEAADLILLLVSSDFIKSDYCIELETARALEREQEGSATVLPIFLRECHVEGLPFTYLQGAPRDMRWIDQQVNQDKAWAEVVSKIRQVAETSAAPPPHHQKQEILLRNKRKRSSKQLILISLVVLVLIATVAGYFWQQNNKPQPLQSAESLLQQGEYQAAQNLCTEASESPAKTRCLRIANLMLEQRNVEQFYAAAENEPDKAYALTIMGEVEAAQEDYTNANKHYRHAIELNPAIAQAYFGIGQILHQQGNIQEALRWYEDAAERAPNNRRYLHNLAATFAENNQPPLAEEKYRALLKMDNSQLLAYAELVELLQNQGKTGEAEQLAAQAQKGLAANPDWKDKPLNAQAWFVLQDGKAAYLDTWATKQAWLDQVFAVE